jgi:ankyrin repeat protein
MKYITLLITLVHCAFLCGLTEQEEKEKREKEDFKKTLLNDEFAHEDYDFSEVKKFIKKYGINVKLDKEENTPLHIAASRGASEKEIKRKTPIDQRNDVALIKYLIGAEADLNAKNANVQKNFPQGQTPYEFAEYNRKFDVLDYLTGSGFLTWAIIERKELEKIKGLLEIFSYELNQQDLRGNTPLHHAAGRGNLAIIKLLLARGANPSIKNKAGFLPIDLARAFGKKKVVAFFNTYPYQMFSKDLITLAVLL